MYRRLLVFLRPHTWRMSATIACNIGAALLDVFSFTLLIPFLDALFGTQTIGRVTKIQEQIVGAFLRSGDAMGS